VKILSGQNTLVDVDGMGDLRLDFFGGIE